MSEDDRFVTRAELERYVKHYGAYRTVLEPTEAYHTDPDCIWGNRIKKKNLRDGFGKRKQLCPFCWRSPAESPT